MTSTGSVTASWLRPIPPGAAPSLVRAGHLGHTGRRLGPVLSIMEAR
ncbi:hypothetical protein GA0070615_0527 [Micromonospora aurantiaca]|nr:hypothetical protein GA0070615_0527 [Micromonospora aurantiaca]